MMQLGIPKIEEDVLASSLRKQVSHLEEIIDGIERRDTDLDQVREMLGWMATNLSQIRKRIPAKAA